jgi:hypothetical protein
MVDFMPAAEGVIRATPEYHDGYSSVIKLVIDNLEFPSALKGNPLRYSALQLVRSVQLKPWKACAVSVHMSDRLCCPAQSQLPVLIQYSMTMVHVTILLLRNKSDRQRPTWSATSASVCV